MNTPKSVRLCRIGFWVVGKGRSWRAGQSGTPPRGSSLKMNFRDGRARQGAGRDNVPEGRWAGQALKTGGSSAGQVGLTVWGAGSWYDLSWGDEEKAPDPGCTSLEELCPEAHPTPTCTASLENP